MYASSQTKSESSFIQIRSYALISRKQTFLKWDCKSITLEWNSTSFWHVVCNGIMLIQQAKKEKNMQCYREINSLTIQSDATKWNWNRHEIDENYFFWFFYSTLCISITFCALSHLTPSYSRLRLVCLPVDEIKWLK